MPTALNDLLEDLSATVELELLVHDDLPCAAPHKDGDMGPDFPRECSGEVVAIGPNNCAGIRVPICQNVVDYIERRRAGAYHCGFCQRPLSECWSAIPI
jgi:hypothetical protein